ncbi:MAG: imidazole glycerol phosphate synthase subunit HisH, partial [Anaerolineales bacterium]|nr:imidazole glycerol phosphate synthase subunit HisH [Anaerolineales bacterium]
MIALIDHGVGNLRSVEKALAAVGASVALTADPARLLAADKVVLPGVGAFADAMDGLRSRGLIAVVSDIAGRGTPFLGICVGMQMLFETSEEHGEHPGLGLLPGRVRRFEPGELKVPQTGWNQVRPQGDPALLAGLGPGSYAYFNHSYYCDPVDPADVLGWRDSLFAIEAGGQQPHYHGGGIAGGPRHGMNARLPVEPVEQIVHDTRS